ncbi:MAG TPA: DUF1810 domain-containing protein [Spirochaetia bacterium]|nr:DUF1810 domain-containing protein [Spirochaetia bacterium]
MPGTDPFDLQRFVGAQAGSFAAALGEIRAGRKRSHWIWFIFPQVRGLGVSSTSQHYGISGIDEARAYLEHPVLGPRLLQCTEALLSLESRNASAIMPYPDDLKLRSCMTLFERAAGPGAVFSRVLDEFYQGRRDERTIDLLGGG